MLDEAQARGMHRRLKARFSPTEIFTITPASQPTNTPAPPADPPANPPANNPAPSSAAAAGPGPAAQPSASSAASAPQSASSTSASTSSTSSSSSSSSTVSSTSSTASSTTSSSTSASAPTTAPSAPAASKPAQQEPGLGASIPSVGSHTSTYTAPFGGLPTAAAPSNTAAASNSGDTTGTVKAPVVVGIVVAVIAGIVGIVFAVTYFMRRNNRDEEDEILRRQSMVLPDEGPSRGMPPNRGITPRPPSMLEQHMNTPVSFAPQQHFTDASYYGGYEQHPYAQGQVLTMPPQAWTPVTPHSGQPFFNPMGDTPLGSPVSPAPYDSAYNAQGQLVRQPSSGASVFMDQQAGQGAYLERQGSNGADYMLNRQPSPGPNVPFNRQPSPGPNVPLNRQPSLGPNVPFNGPPAGQSPYVTRQVPGGATQLELPPEAHYVDLSRSSVSPFQAAQYAEISNHLQTAPPAPLPTPMVAAAVDKAIMEEDPIVPTVSEPRPLKIANPGRVTSPVEALEPSPFNDPQPTHEHFDADEDFVPRAPSPAYSSKSRIDSTPPKLPEISVQQRAFSPVVMNFPLSPPAVTPSPLAQHVDLPSPPSEAHFSAPPTPRPTKDAPAPVRPDTVYDDEDAYGGI